MKRRTEQRQAKKLRETVMKQLRDTRAQMQKDHPGLFTALRTLVAQASPAPDQGQQKAAPSPKKTKLKQPPKEDEEIVQIDRKKNLEAVLKYAASKPDADLSGLKKDLKKFLN